MSTVSVMFYGLGVLAAASAISILFIRNVFYAALLLIVCLLAIAGIYVIAQAELLAVTQILIYAGGILVLIIFGIMLTSKISGKPLVVENKNWFPGVLVGVFFMATLTNLFSNTTFHANASDGTFFRNNSIDSIGLPSTYNSVNKFGILLSTDYVIPFEVTGILLLVALVAASVVASSFNAKKW
jgi:NADH:ubiquinone oxidoreductase subunit 6 (subunit J)